MIIVLKIFFLFLSILNDVEDKVADEDEKICKFLKINFAHKSWDKKKQAKSTHRRR